MKFWTKINLRWTGEQLASWSSVSKTLYLLFPLIVYFLLGDVVELLCVALLDMLSKEWVGVRNLVENYSSELKAVIYVTEAVAVFFVLRRMFVNEMTGEKENGRKPLKIADYALVVFISLASSIGLNYLIGLINLPKMSATYESVYEGQFELNIFFAMFAFGIISPIIEEIIFRGIIYNRASRIFSPTIAIILSALLFGLFHGNIVQIPYAVIMGLIITFLYKKYSDFKVPCLFHIVANLGVYVLNYTIWR